MTEPVTGGDAARINREIRSLREAVRAFSIRLARIELELAALKIERGEFDRDNGAGAP